MVNRAINIEANAADANYLFSNSGYNSLFKVVHPQRRFKWTSTEIKQFWDDIVQAYQQNRPWYFLGTLLLQPQESDEVFVLDGQQRISTISMLLAILRDCCKDYGLDDREHTLHRLIARVDDDGLLTGSLVLTLQRPDNQIYQQVVGERESTKKLSLLQSRKEDRVLPAAQALYGYVRRFIQNEPNPTEALRSLCGYIQRNVRLLPIEVADEGQAYLVFDTTNTRGLRLSPAEAIKARLAAIAREDIILSRKLITRWNTAAIALEQTTLPIDAMDNYLHAIWSSKHGYTTKRTLDKVVDRVIKDKGNREVEYLAEDIGRYVQSYLAIVRPDGNSSLAEDLRDLNRLNVQANGFLTMVHYHAHNRFEEAVSLTLSLQIRNITIGNYRPARYQENWPSWASQVRNGNTNSAFDEIRAQIVPDDEFVHAFKIAVVESSTTVRHLLRKLDPISSSGSGVLPYEVDAEHILPKAVVDKLLKRKKLTKNVKTWITDLGENIPADSADEQILGEKLHPFLNMLGNQALLNSSRNRKGKDKPFLVKQDQYKSQALHFTKNLADLPKWDMAEIMRRQDMLAERAPAIWKRR